MGVLSYFITVLLVVSSGSFPTYQDDLTDPGIKEDIQCLSCADVSTPFDCYEVVWCGKGEVCYTRETTNHRGEHAFRMGCENKKRCDMYSQISTLFGKRDTEQTTEKQEADDTADKQCYSCCETNECNSGLCPDATGLHHPGNHTKCPRQFVHGPHACYYVANWTEDWHKARQICHQRNGDLVSINDKAEQDFLVGLLRPRGSKINFWIGGFYVAVQKEWTWVDHTVMTFSAWSNSDRRITNYFVAMINPLYGNDYRDWEWGTTTPIRANGFICESPFI